MLVCDFFVINITCVIIHLPITPSATGSLEELAALNTFRCLLSDSCMLLISYLLLLPMANLTGLTAVAYNRFDIIGLFKKWFIIDINYIVSIITPVEDCLVQGRRHKLITIYQITSQKSCYT